MTALELDHLFAFVQPDFVDSADHAALRRFGLTVEFGRVHVGQGTANRLALFPEHYLEFLWLRDRDEAERNPLRLDRRADWRATGSDPFGVCLRGRLDAELRERCFWPYRLEGMPEPIWIARVSDDPRWPMLFVFDGEQHRGPRSRGHAPEHLQHEGGQTGIARATLTSRDDFARALGPIAASLPTNLRLQIGHANADPRLEVELTGSRREPVTIAGLTLAIFDPPSRGPTCA